MPDPTAHPAGLDLRSAAQRAGKILGMYTVGHDVQFNDNEARLISKDFSLIADGNDLKFSNRLRPTPDSYNFLPADGAVDWSQRNGLLFRAHTLVWHNALPNWFNSYVNKTNAQLVMTTHITTVMRHFKGKVYSWDVVNEPIHNDGRPDVLRRKPWLDLIGPDYIEIAFRTAAEADPKAKLILNECYVEHDSPVEAQRRDALLQLATSLKKKGVPITGIGVQGHIRSDTPLAPAAMKAWLKAVQDLGLEIMITELDVDDSNIPNANVDEIVARKYGEYLDIVGPFASVITFEQLADNVNLPKRADGIPHRPNLFDTKYQKKAAYNAVLSSLNNMSEHRHTS